MDYQQAIPNVGTSAGPSWAEGNGQVWLAWKGQGSDPRIFVVRTTTPLPLPDPTTGHYTFDDLANAQVGHVGTSAGPAIAHFKNTAYLAWKGESDSKICWATSPDGKTWTVQPALSSKKGAPPPGTSHSPALASDGSSVYMAWKGESSNTIWWAKCSDGKTWTEQQALSSENGPPPGTSDAPALASDGGSVYMAWKGESDSRIWWAKCSDGKTWTGQQKGPSGANAGPALVVDGTKAVWLAWNGPQTANYDHGFFGVFGFQVYFSSLINEAKNQWSPRASRFGVATTNRPALVSTGKDSTGLMLAWSGVEGPLAAPQPEDAWIYYGTLRLPPQAYDFTLPQFEIRMMRSGTIFGKTESDTDYVSFSLKVLGQKPQVLNKFVGDQTGGIVPVGLAFNNVKLQDTDSVVFHYSIINRGGSESNANLDFLKSAATTLLNAAETADGNATATNTGSNLSSISPSEAGALIGAAIGEAIPIPVLGPALGALAGWLIGLAPWGSLWPDCDGPVAAGLHIYDAATIRAVAGKHAFANAEDNPGVNSPGGCGQNSDYVVNWTIAIAPSAGT